MVFFKQTANTPTLEVAVAVEVFTFVLKFLQVDIQVQLELQGVMPNTVVVELAAE